MTKKEGRKFVLLEGLEAGNRFFTGFRPGDEPTKLYDGTVAYRVLDYADSIAEAQTKLYGPPEMTPKELLKLIRDLAWFIENVNQDTPDRNERFFALRERWRKALEQRQP